MDRLVEMDVALAEFKKWCRDAFGFLADYGFHELPDSHPNHRNPFQARFGNGSIEVLVLGEGYGTMARVVYITSDGIEAPSEILEPGWEPFKKQKRKKKSVQFSQMEQIEMTAQRIRERDAAIYLGDMTQLNKAATRWKTICEKMG